MVEAMGQATIHVGVQLQAGGELVAGQQELCVVHGQLVRGMAGLIVQASTNADIHVASATRELEAAVGRQERVQRLQVRQMPLGQGNFTEHIAQDSPSLDLLGVERRQLEVDVGAESARHDIAVHDQLAGLQVQEALRDAQIASQLVVDSPAELARARDAHPSHPDIHWPAEVEPRDIDEPAPLLLFLRIDIFRRGVGRVG